VTIKGEPLSSVVQFFNDSPDLDPQPLVLLADKTNLLSIYHAPILVCDGTYAFRPQGFDNGQTYTIHAVFPNLPDKQSSFLCGKF